MVDEIRWQLELGGEVIARISDSREYEFPWTYGVVVASPQFDRFRPYFTDPETWPDDDLAMNDLCDEITSRGWFLLRDFQTGVVHQPMTFNQNSAYVWFRIG